MFQIHRSKDGKWFWTLQDQGNNETLCQSETYNSKESARIGITAAISAAATGRIQDLS